MRCDGATGNLEAASEVNRIDQIIEFGIESSG